MPGVDYEDVQTISDRRRAGSACSVVDCKLTETYASEVVAITVAIGMAWPALQRRHAPDWPSTRIRRQHEALLIAGIRFSPSSAVPNVQCHSYVFKRRGVVFVFAPHGNEANSSISWLPSESRNSVPFPAKVCLTGCGSTRMGNARGGDAPSAGVGRLWTSSRLSVRYSQ